MASITTQPGNAPAPAERIEPVPPDQQRMALALLLTGRPNPELPAVDGFLRFAQEHNLALDRFWLAWHDGKPAAACLLLPSAGRTAMAFISPVPGPSQTALASRVVDVAVRHQDPAAASLVQALLEEHQHLEQRALAQAGFIRLATLRYMDRIADLPPAPLNLPLPDIQCLHYRQDRRQAFAAAILATYEQTLDCPALVGLRDVHDVIAGHMAAGRFDPDLWFAFYQNDKPVSVMLLAEAPQRRAYELVYLGVAADYRGRGIAGAMLRHGLGLVSQRAAAQTRDLMRICLAVDADNTPAARLYERLGFQATARKVAMIRAVEHE